MNRATVKGYKAPHKPVLLLSILELIRSGEITDNHIMLDEKLRKKFKYLWESLVVGDSGYDKVVIAKGLELELSHQYPFRCDIALPYYHMQHEPFWTLIKSEEWAECKSVSVAYLQRAYHFAELDSKLFHLMNNAESCYEIQQTLIELI